MMIFTKKSLLVRVSATILVALLILGVSGCSTNDPAQNSQETAFEGEPETGYTSAVFEGESEKGASFLVCGTDGRLDRIFEDGTFENVPLPVGDKSLTSVFKADGITLVGGMSGALAYSRDGAEFELANGAGEEHIMGMTQFAGEYYACTYGGNILSSSDGISWKNAKKLTDKPLIGIAADNGYIMAITSDTDIFKSADGKEWDLQNYNEVYQGLAESLVFSGLLNFDGTFIVFGCPLGKPDEPAVKYTYDAGEVWRSATLAEVNGRAPEEFYPLVINSLRLFQGEIFVACDGGKVLTYTSCPTCNVVSETSSKADLRCMEIYGDTLLVAGEDFHFEILNADSYRQNRISAEQAQLEMSYGAVMVDVRTNKEYSKAPHIPGCLHIPVDEIESRLPAEVPNLDTVLIFYCSVGSRAQTALETAQELGYQNAFNLGSLSDWPYEIEYADAEA